MPREQLEDSELIVRQVEWDEFEPWEHAAGEDDSLGAAQRFMAAQSFMLSWQNGKVPTGWRRPRRLGDFDGAYPQHVVDMAQDRINQLIAERNQRKTAQLAAMGAGRGSPASVPDAPSLPAVSRKQVDELKAGFSQFSDEFFELKTALSKASTAVADLSLRTQALTELIDAQATSR